MSTENPEGAGITAPVRRILHVDMDAFYASVEQHDRPELRGKPVIVAGSERSRGVVATASYEARRFGVRSAMPTSRALRLCPDVIRVSPRHERYREISDQVHDLFREYTDLIEPLSLDESFLDLTAWCDERGARMHEVAAEIRREIRQRTGLTASAGAAPNKLVAKIASDLKKPDGLVVVRPSEVRAFMRPLPVERLWGVGPVTASRLHSLGLVRAGDIADRDPAWLESLFGRSGPLLHALALGEDDRPVVTSHEPRSLSAENTFAVDVEELGEVLACLREQAEEVAARLQRHGYRGKTVTIKVRYGDFTTISRSASPSRPLERAEAIFETARLLLEKTEFPGRALRLVGVGVSGLVPRDQPVQLEFWDVVPPGSAHPPAEGSISPCPWT